MRRASIILAALITTAAFTLAAPPPEVRPAPMTPAPSRPGWMSGDRNALSPPLRNALSDPQPGYRPSIWHRVERDLDRSMWRIIDTPTYELNRLELERAANRSYADPRVQQELQRELFEYERDRQLQIEALRYRQDRARAREDLMRLREYELGLNAGLRGAIGEQATADRRALQAARERRDDDLLRATSVDERAAAEATYQTERARILGVPPIAEPAPVPAVEQK